MFGPPSSDQLSSSSLSLPSQPLFSFPPLPSPTISFALSSSPSSLSAEILLRPAADSYSDRFDVEDSKLPSPSRSLSPTLAASSPGELTQDSKLTFDSYGSLKAFLTDYALCRGFDLRWKVRGGETKPVHGGTARCWCEEKEGKEESQPSLPEPVATTRQTDMRRRRAMWVERRQRVRCGCNWRVNFFRRADRKYVITDIRVLVHNGHEVKPVSSQPHIISSLINVPDDAQQVLEGLVRSGVAGQHVLRRYVQSHLNVTIDDATFHNLVNKTKRGLGMATEPGDFKPMLKWLERQLIDKKAVGAFEVSDEGGIIEIDRVFYMATDMVYNLDRNGCILIMDSTHKTNRFNWPLLLVCGINQHFQTVLLAVALVKHQTSSIFVWVLQQMRAAVSAEAWNDVACVATDGDQAMEAAIEEVLPHSHHLRCWYHLEQNLRHNLYRVLGESFDTFLDNGKAAAGTETTEDFVTAKRDLHAAYPAAVSCLEKNIWKNEESFATCFTKRWATLGILGTQRVEGMNAKLKGMLHVNSRTAVSVLFETLEYASSDIDLAAVTKMQELDREQAKLAYTDTFAARIHPHVTRYAQGMLLDQFDVMLNYRATAYAGLQQNCYHVQRFTQSGIAVGAPRVVHYGPGPVLCSCFFPTVHLLPCRHVMCVNHSLLVYAFQVRQIGARWLRSHKPPAKYLQRAEAAMADAAPPPEPTYLSAQGFNRKLPSRKHRYGELRGLSDKFAATTAERGDIYYSALARLQELCRWADKVVATPPVMEAAVSSAVVGGDQSSSFAVQPASTSSSSSSQPSLHQTLSVEELNEPRQPAPKRHRPSKKRTASQGERPSGRR
jgi:hypothetical protein